MKQPQGARRMPGADPCRTSADPSENVRATWNDPELKTPGAHPPPPSLKRFTEGLLNFFLYGSGKTCSIDNMRPISSRDNSGSVRIRN